MFNATAPAATDDVAPAITQPTSATKALQQLVNRVTPKHAGKVLFCVASGKATRLEGKEGKLIVTAPTRSEAARAYGYYLRHIAHSHLSWNGDRKSASLILPDAPVNVPETLPFNTAFNYCTFSYTCVHWDKERWGKELDRLALSGYKYVLVTPGLEKVWQCFLQELGCPQKNIADFIPNPTHAAWWNMGNLEGEGGPVSQALIDSEAELGRFIVKRLRELGLEPILQGYVGFLPHNFAPKGTEGSILKQGQWCGYTRPAVLQPTAQSFPKLAALWYKHLHAVYGITAKAYGGDLFHEGGNKGNTHLEEAAKSVQKAMQEASPDSIWFLQAWGHNPDAKLLSGTSPSHTVVLFLNKNMSEKGGNSFNFQGRRHVWCELSNFGGNNGLFGGIPLMENLEVEAGGYSGFGLLSEGLETNPFYYEVFTERLNDYRSKIDRNTLIQRYSQARYGCDNAHIAHYLGLLAESVYRPDQIREGCLENIQCARPSLWAKKVSTWSNPTLYYDTDKVEQAARELLVAGKEVGPALTELATYRYDLVDICRQVMADRARKQLDRCRIAFENKDETALRKESTVFLQQIDTTAELLACSKYFLLGNYIEGAKRRGKTSGDKAQIEKSLRRLLTTWKAADSSLLDDYANREYSELLSSYYKRRWEAYFASCFDTLKGKAGEDTVGRFRGGSSTNNGENTKFRIEKNSKVEAIERAFPTAKIPLLSKSKGNPLPLAEKILSK